MARGFRVAYSADTSACAPRAWHADDGDRRFFSDRFLARARSPLARLRLIHLCITMIEVAWVAVAGRAGGVWPGWCGPLPVGAGPGSEGSRGVATPERVLGVWRGAGCAAHDGAARPARVGGARGVTRCASRALVWFARVAARAVGGLRRLAALPVVFVLAAAVRWPVLLVPCFFLSCLAAVFSAAVDLVRPLHL